MKDDISKELFEPMKLFGKLVLFAPSRIKNEDISKGIYRYEYDKGRGIICQISTLILVNHWGTILSNKPIKLNPDGYCDIDEDKDIEYLSRPAITISQYQNRFKDKSQER
ncbi:MAG: hypothetical protein PUF50_03485 [Erysipelotrichaceae bacterium]|nr:hypothetical protein [Erysipelotrichaceae bacterium]